MTDTETLRLACVNAAATALDIPNPTTRDELRDAADSLLGLADAVRRYVTTGTIAVMNLG